MLKTMTVKDLIERLQDADPDAPVYFSYNYGDYWRTQVAAPIRDVDELELVRNGRLDMLEVAETPEGQEPVIGLVISS